MSNFLFKKNTCGVRAIHHRPKVRCFPHTSDKTQIRANQGHSISVDLNLISKIPPAILFHGTAKRFLTSIQEQGLIAGTRQHVHLSHDKSTALTVGKRHGEPFIFEINALAMSQAGHDFYLSENGVWLTYIVPVQFLTKL
jgi:putative RNA 2'-phosphotransferase